jgi:hypothetical protein
VRDILPTISLELRKARARTCSLARARLDGGARQSPQIHAQDDREGKYMIGDRRTCHALTLCLKITLGPIFF